MKLSLETFLRRPVPSSYQYQQALTRVENLYEEERDRYDHLSRHFDLFWHAVVDLLDERGENGSKVVRQLYDGVLEKTRAK